MTTTVADARALYEDLAALTTTVGAFGFANDSEAQWFDLVGRQIEIEADCTVEGPEPRDDEERGRLLIHVQSPWHAVIHLMGESRSWLNGRYAGLRQPLIFRGQRDCRWPLQASIFRPGVDRAFETRAIRIFIECLRRTYRNQAFTDLLMPGLSIFSESESPVPEAVHIATAQHFGMKTGLLDFSTDPAVAIWFACQGANGHEPELASVFAVPLHFASPYASLLLPHPYVRRLYRQRGVFIPPYEREGDEDGLGHGRAIRHVSIEVRFPPDPDFRILRDTSAFRPVVPEHLRVDWAEPEPYDATALFPEEQWWNDLVLASYELARDGRLDALMKSPDHELGRFIGDLALPQQFMRCDNKSQAIMDATHVLVQMLLALTTGMSRDMPSVPTVAPLGLRATVGANFDFLTAMYDLMHQFVRHYPKEEPLRVAAEPMLAELGTALRAFGAHGRGAQDRESKARLETPAERPPPA